MSETTARAVGLTSMDQGESLEPTFEVDHQKWPHKDMYALDPANIGDLNLDRSEIAGVILNSKTTQYERAGTLTNISMREFANRFDLPTENMPNHHQLADGYYNAAVSILSQSRLKESAEPTRISRERMQLSAEIEVLEEDLADLYFRSPIYIADTIQRRNDFSPDARLAPIMARLWTAERAGIDMPSGIHDRLQEGRLHRTARRIGQSVVRNI